MCLVMLDDSARVRDCTNIHHVITSPNPFFICLSYNSGHSRTPEMLGSRPVPDLDEIPDPQETPKPLCSHGVKLEYGDNWWNSDKGCKDLEAVDYDEMKFRQEMMVKGLYLTEGE